MYDITCPYCGEDDNPVEQLNELSESEKLALRNWLQPYLLKSELVAKQINYEIYSYFST